MSPARESRKTARFEHSVPFFWPMTAMIEMEEEGLELFKKDIKALEETVKVEVLRPPPEWATKNKVVLELHTLRLRDFSKTSGSDGDGEVPTLVDAPYAGHTSTIADYHRGQSLVETLRAGGLERVLVTDWKSATPEMKDYDIDNYLAELNVCVDDLGGRVNLIGLCQGGWFTTMYTARYPEKVRTLVLAGAPIDTDAGGGPIKEAAHSLPLSFFEELVESGGGVLRGDYMLTGFKGMHPDKQYIDKYLELYEHVDDPDYLSRFETFERWYESPINLPGKWYLQVVSQVFKENLLFKGRFVGLGKRLSLRHITCPVYLLAGSGDDITPKEQVFNAEKRLGTPKDKIAKALVPGGHIGLFMGERTLKEHWPAIAAWIVREGAAP